MTELHDLHDLPALDRRGSERDRALRAVEKVLGCLEPLPGVGEWIVDALIEAGILPDETGPGRFLMENQSRGELIRRVKALHAEAREMEQILAGALGYLRGDGTHVPAGQFDIGDHTPITLAEGAAKAIEGAAKEIVTLRQRNG